MDDRYEYTKHTVLACLDYFDTIRIVNTGDISFENKLRSITSSNKLTITNLTPFYGDLELVKGNFIKDIDDGDWFMWLDADERPSQFLLDSLSSIIYHGEKNKNRCIRFPWLHHDAEQPDIVVDGYKYLCDNFYTETGEYNHTKIPYAKDILIRKTNMLSPNSNFGGHGSYAYDDTNVSDAYKLCVVNHYKSNLAIQQSTVYGTWFLSLIHVNTANQKEFIYNNVCYNEILKFRKRTGAILQNDLITRLRTNDVEFKTELKTLLTSDIFANATDWYTHYYQWAKNFDCNVDTIQSYCGHQCCKYNDFQL